LSEDYGREAEA